MNQRHPSDDSRREHRSASARQGKPPRSGPARPTTPGIPDKSDKPGRSSKSAQSGGPATSRNRAHSGAAAGREPDVPRQLAYEVLHAVSESDSYANLILPGLMRRRGVYGRDAAFTTELAYGTLRLQGRYDAIIAIAARRDPQTLDTPVLDVLRLGVHQLLGMRIPTHAAVSETVTLGHAVTGPGPAQLINAVLRRISTQDLDTWLAQLSQGAGNEDQRLAHVHSHPEWIVRALRQALGTSADTADVIELLNANNTPPAVSLALRPGLADAADAPDSSPGRFAPTARTLRAGDPAGLPGVIEGSIGVQDEGSQLVALALAAAPIDGRDRVWLDLCAGPGGKAALLAASLAARTVRDGEDADHITERDQHRPLTRHFVANEASGHRTDLLRSAMTAIPSSIDVEIRTSDGRTVGDLEPESYDRVLVDAPCTGLGALRRRPEARWRRQPSDLAQLTQLQQELLTSAITATRIGGVIAYVVCSPHVAETSLIVADVRKRIGATSMAVEELDAATILGSVAAHPVPDCTGGYVQLWPHRHGTDAMFLALLRRTA